VAAVRPILLGPNQPRRFYRGGAEIAGFRGTPIVDGYRPEDWVASTTSRFGSCDDGQSPLPGGGLLRDAIDADPEAWLGPAHVAYFGVDSALLVKLLDAGQRLPVHVHPDRTFAYRHLGSRHGKTEAWVILGTTGHEPAVYLGWSRDVEVEELARWAADGDGMPMLANMNKLAVSPGDAVLVPAGTAHAIGEGVFCVELQEPTDFSIMLEVDKVGPRPDSTELGLGVELAISCVNTKAFGAGALAELHRRAQALGPGPVDVMPRRAAPYFRCERVTSTARGPLGAAFAVVVVVSGAGSLSGPGWDLAVERGNTVVVPWAAGLVTVTGSLDLIRCLPPLPGDASNDDPARATGDGSTWQGADHS